MIFNSPLFLFLFLPFFFAIYFAADKKTRRIIGVLGSFLFFSWGQTKYIPLMLGIIFWNYELGRRIGRNKKVEFSSKILWLGIGGNLAILTFFKILSAYGSAWSLPLFEDLGFPLGLSYITFQAISYLIDIDKGRVPAEANLLNFSLYIMLFPKIIVGPITRYSKIANQLPAPDIHKEEIAAGIRRFIRGMAKKVLIADLLAPFVNATFDLGAESIHTNIAWLALIAYALQIYFDFSGYTDMALGLGQMMGFHFEENFNFPYISQSVSEFWRRWHISLSTWFRDYVFYPLERRRIKILRNFRQPINIIIVFLLTGLWHGIESKFIVWGALHGFFMALESLFLARFLHKIFRPLRHLYALTAILLTWIIFRSPSLPFAWNFILRLLGEYHGYTQPTFSQSTPLPFIEPSFLLALICGVLLSTPLFSYLNKKLSTFLKPLPSGELLIFIASDGILFVLFIASLAMLANSQFAPGIYGGF